MEAFPPPTKNIFYTKSIILNVLNQAHIWQFDIEMAIFFPAPFTSFSNATIF